MIKSASGYQSIVVERGDDVTELGDVKDTHQLSSFKKHAFAVATVTAVALLISVGAAAVFNSGYIHLPVLGDDFTGDGVPDATIYYLGDYGNVYTDGPSYMYERGIFDHMPDATSIAVDNGKIYYLLSNGAVFNEQHENIAYMPGAEGFDVDNGIIYFNYFDCVYKQDETLEYIPGEYTEPQYYYNTEPLVCFHMGANDFAVDNGDIYFLAEYGMGYDGMVFKQDKDKNIDLHWVHNAGETGWSRMRPDRFVVRNGIIYYYRYQWGCLFKQDQKEPIDDCYMSSDVQDITIG